MGAVCVQSFWIHISLTKLAQKKAKFRAGPTRPSTVLGVEEPGFNEGVLICKPATKT